MKATKLVEAVHVRVVHTDGTEHDYTSAPVDVWRTERLTGKAIHEALMTFTGIAALGYSCAVRAGDAYRTRKAGTDEQAGFAEWLESVADVLGLDDEAADADPKADDSQTG